MAGRTVERTRIRDQFIRGIRSSTVQLRLMRERPKTLNEALQLAGQYQGVEESQKRLHGASAKVETMAVGKEDDSESESEAVAATTNATRPSRLATQVEQLGKQIETLKLQLAATIRTMEEPIRDHARTTLYRGKEAMASCAGTVASVVILNEIVQN